MKVYPRDRPTWTIWIISIQCNFQKNCIISKEKFFPGIRLECLIKYRYNYACWY